ncbi:TIGR01244 family sulfur transferase [Sphingomonas sp. 28-63-12]|uniref:TIGR01244 family sulfur transferase n=1 Tax=Sphingomonas sp. 28-63-12 TaxID=1970434 RepID=UPI000BD02BC0|nr:MAG: TIGR01244 family protein [Sphingomonas sp. 28-63-12]
MIRPIDDIISVSPQITPADVTEIARAGFTMIVNNRPDDEELGQPEGDAIRTVAETLGLKYVAIPITHAGFSHPQLDAMATALAEANGPVLAYCRSGTRSCNLWALAMAKSGAAPDLLSEKAAKAGYDLSGIRPMLDALAGA